MQLFYNLSDPGMEDLLYEVESVRRFVGLRLTEALPDETTILNFRHLLEKHGLGEGLFEEINAHLASRGHRLRTGTIVDASIIFERALGQARRAEAKYLKTDGLTRPLAVSPPPLPETGQQLVELQAAHQPVRAQAHHEHDDDAQHEAAEPEQVG